MNVKPLLLSGAMLFIAIFSTAQVKLWSDENTQAASGYISANKGNLPEKYRLLKLNKAYAGQLQVQAPKEAPGNIMVSSPVSIELPLPEGGYKTGSLIESSVLDPVLQQQNPSIRTYRITDPVTRDQLGRITISPLGMTGLLFTPKGSVYISPAGDAQSDVHMIYYVKNVKTMGNAVCGTVATPADIRPYSATAGDCQLRTFELGIAATGEYTTWAGSQANALTYITTTVNNVTAIYERDATIRFTLVTNNSLLFTNAATDPYATTASPNTTTLNTNHSTLVSTLTSGGFDLGMVFNDDWDGGLAYLSVVCNGSLKGGGAAGLTFGTGANPTAGPQGPVFDATVAHEIAHQFSATHSFIANNGGCSGNTTVASSWEPGGGSTIMAYANVCSPNYYIEHAELYFHAGNIAQIQSYATSGSASCATTTSSGNTAPTVSVAAASYSIPISTPFTLNATGADVNGNTLLYTWEQMDAGVAASSVAPASTNTTGPMFRSYFPSTSSSRTFPNLNDIILGNATPYEVLPSVGRTMNFRVTVRDQAAGGGCTAEANVALTTSAGAGPFIVTSQTTATNWTANGTNTATITWNVANTNAAPVNCSAVDILFSTDGGITYPYTLVSNTSNDGTETITIPNLATEAGRIRVQSRNNVFFNINTALITITSTCGANANTFTPTSNVSAQAGNAGLNLTLTPSYGTLVTPSGTLTSGDPAGLLAVNNIAVGSCIAFSNEYRYDTYTFVPNVSGNYTFTRTAGSGLLVYNLYQGSSFNGDDPCQNLIISNGTFNGATVGLAGNISAALTGGMTYTLTVGTFAAGTPALPAAYTISVTPPGGGNIYTTTPDPGASYNYTYVIVNNATGNITAIDPSADLSNSATFPGGTSYTVYGMSYLNTIPIGTINGYIGGSYTTLYNDLLNNPATRCGNISKNSIQVSVLAATPVSFLGLTARKQSGDQVILNWKTATEQNNDRFEIQRSADGVNFNSILGAVPGSGNSVLVRSYAFTDKTPLATWNFYRIRQVDRDGKSSYSNVASLNFGKLGTGMAISPNPASDRVQVEWTSSASQKLEFLVLDNKGALVFRIPYTTAPGLNRMMINVGQLSKGVYLIKVNNSGTTETGKFIKQ